MEEIGELATILNSDPNLNIKETFSEYVSKLSAVVWVCL